MNISEKKLDNSSIELQIDVPVEKVELEYKAVYDKLQRSAKIDGFRKGKAPIHMVELKYKEYADGEVAENLVKSSFLDAVTEKQLTPIAQPKYEFNKIDRGEPFSFKVIFEVPPTIQIGKYKDISVEEVTCSINDEDIDAEIDARRERDAKVTKKEEGAVIKNGDLVTIQIKRIDNIDINEKDKVEYKNYTIVVGKSKDESALDKYIVDMKVNEEKEVEVKYPKDYYIEDLAKQKVKYLVKISEINDMEMPELNDDYAKKHNYESVADFKNKIREYYENYIVERTKGDAKAEMLKIISESSTFDLPGSMIINEMAAVFRKTQERVGYYAKSIDEFSAAIGMSSEEFSNKLKEESIQSIKTTLILMEVVKKENLKVPEEEYKKVLEGIAKQKNTSIEEIEKLIEQNHSRENIETELLLAQAMDFIYENAKVKKLKPISFSEFIKK